MARRDDASAYIRAHGVHRGADLKDPFNIDPDTGNFKDYTTVEFPADAKNCTSCHANDNWKTKPTRLACGTCHDNVWFGDAGATPTGWVNHSEGPMPDDSACAGCHTADSSGTAPIAAAHDTTPATALDSSIEFSIDAPANATNPSDPSTGFYQDGETPQVTVVIKDAGGIVVDPTTITEAAWYRVQFFVHGPRGLAKPVLTTAAQPLGGRRASVTNGVDAPWDLSGGIEFSLAVDSAAPIRITSTLGASASQAEVVAWLNGDAGFSAVAKAYTSGRVLSAGESRRAGGSTRRWGSASSAARSAGRGAARRPPAGR